PLCARQCRKIKDLRTAPSERNVVVEVSAALVRRRRTLVVVVGGLLLAAAATTATTVVAAATTHAAATAVEHLHLVGDDLGGVAVVTLLVLPLARAQAAFDVDLRSLLQVLAG